MNDNSNKTVTLNSSINRIPIIARLLILFVIVFATLVIALPASASELDDFETAATTDNADPESDGEEKKEECHYHVDFFNDFFRELLEDMMEVIFSIIYDQAKLSNARIDGSIETAGAQVEIRQIGEPALPFFQMDYKYFDINPEIKALDECFEFGYGALGFEVRNTYFIEIYPRDRLTLSEYHLLLRLSRTGSQEYGIGVGMINIKGNEENSGLSFTFPIKIYPNQFLGVKFKPTCNWIHGNFIRDNDLSVVLSQRFGSLSFGYRFLEVNGVDLNGSYVGASLHF